MAIDLKIDNLRTGELAPLYHRYPIQIKPQPAYVTMDDDGVVEVRSDGKIGCGVPLSVWHGVTRRFRVYPCVSADALANYLESDGLSLLERIHAGHSVEWDGSNHVGKLTSDAFAAREQLAEALRSIANAQVWEVIQALIDNGRINLTSEQEQPHGR